MGEFLRFIARFFQGWRRRLGMMTLVMACVFAAAWVRSLAMIDSINRAYRGTAYRVMSVDGRIELRIASQAKISITSGMESKPLGQRRLVDEEIAKRIKSAKRRLEALQHTKETLTPTQFEDLESTAKRSLRELEATLPFYAIPYWSIVIPLILLSAYLLLSKPRAKSTAKIS